MSGQRTMMKRKGLQVGSVLQMMKTTKMRGRWLAIPPCGGMRNLQTKPTFRATLGAEEQEDW